MTESELLANRRACTAALCRSLGYLAAAQMISEGRDGTVEVHADSKLGRQLTGVLPELASGKTIVSVVAEQKTRHG